MTERPPLPFELELKRAVVLLPTSGSGSAPFPPSPRPLAPALRIHLRFLPGPAQWQPRTSRLCCSRLSSSSNTGGKAASAVNRPGRRSSPWAGRSLHELARRHWRRFRADAVMTALKWMLRAAQSQPVSRRAHWASICELRVCQSRTTTRGPSNGNTGTDSGCVARGHSGGCDTSGHVLQRQKPHRRGEVRLRACPCNGCDGESRRALGCNCCC